MVPDGLVVSDLVAAGVTAMTLGITGLNRFGKKAFDAYFAERQAALANASILRALDNDQHRSDGKGQVPILGMGSLTTGWLPAMTTTWRRAGAASYQGSIGLGEASDDLRNECLHGLDASLRSQVIELVVPAFTAGFGGMTVEEVLELEPWWKLEVERFSTAWVDAIDQNTRRTGVSPSLVQAILSPNGHMALSPYAIGEFKHRYPLPPVYGFLAIPEKPATVRHRFPQVYELLGKSGLVDGFIALDNMGDQARNDLGAVQLMTAMATGHWISANHDRQSALNGLRAIFPKDDPGRTGTISTHMETVPVAWYAGYKHKVDGAFYSHTPLLVQRAMLGIERILEDETLQALPLRKAKKGSPRSLCVIAPAEPEYLRAIATEVDQRIGSRLRTLDRDLTLQWASIGQPLTDGGNAVLTFILLQGVDATPKQIAAYTQGQIAGNPAVLPHATRNGNGHSKQLNKTVEKQLTAGKKGGRP